MSSIRSIHGEEAATDVERRYVRIRERRADGFVEFDFAISDPELSVELMLREQDFASFCRHNKVVFLTEAQGRALDLEREKWSTGVPGGVLGPRAGRD